MAVERNKGLPARLGFLRLMANRRRQRNPGCGCCGTAVTARKSTSLRRLSLLFIASSNSRTVDVCRSLHSIDSCTQLATVSSNLHTLASVPCHMQRIQLTSRQR